MLLTLLSLIGAALGQEVVLLEQVRLPEQLRFHQELALTLDKVKLQPAPDAFASAPMAAQLETVRPMLASDTGQAVVWLGGDTTKLWVSVAFVDKERAVIRMIDLPREPDPLPRLALAVRELVATAYTTEPIPAVPTPPPPPPPPPADPVAEWWAGAMAGAVVSIAPLGGGPRAATGVQLYREIGPLEVGTELMGQLGSEQSRLGLGLVGRYSLVDAGVSAEWVSADWPLPLQPRAFIGLWHRWRTGFTAHARAHIHPVRDQVIDGQRTLHDTGWGSVGIFFGWERRLSPH